MITKHTTLSLSALHSSTTRSYQVFQAVRFATVILISILLTRAVADTSAISQYEQYLWVANIFTFFWYMGIGKALLSYYPTIDEQDRPHLITTAYLLLTMLGILTGLFMWLGQAQWLLLLGIEDLPYWPYACGLAAVLLPLSIGELVLLLRRQSKALVYYAISSHAILFALALWYITVMGSIEDFVIGYTVWSVLRWIYVGMLCSTGRWDGSLGLAFVRYARPLILLILIGGGMSYIDGLLVNHYFDSGDFAIWRYGARELPLTMIFITGITAATLPLLRDDLDVQLAALRSQLHTLMTWLIPLSALLILTAPTLYRLVYGSEYLASAWIFATFLLVVISRLLVPQVILQAHLRNTVLVYSAIVEVVINLALSLLLLPYLGLVGIVVGSLVAFLFNKLALVYYVHTRLGIPLDRYLPLRRYLLLVLLLITTFATSWYINH